MAINCQMLDVKLNRDLSYAVHSEIIGKMFSTHELVIARVRNVKYGHSLRRCIKLSKGAS